MSVNQPGAGVAVFGNLRRAAVTLLPGLHKGVSTHRASVDAVSGGRIQQTGGVDLLQEGDELLLTAAAELTRILSPAGRKRKRKMLLIPQDEEQRGRNSGKLTQHSQT